MQVSHVADDYAAIARRLKELQEEALRAEERAAMPPRGEIHFQADRGLRQVKTISQPARVLTG